MVKPKYPVTGYGKKHAELNQIVKEYMRWRMDTGLPHIPPADISLIEVGKWLQKRSDEEADAAESSST